MRLAHFCGASWLTGCRKHPICSGLRHGGCAPDGAVVFAHRLHPMLKIGRALIELGPDRKSGTDHGGGKFGHDFFARIPLFAGLCLMFAVEAGGMFSRVRHFMGKRAVERLRAFKRRNAGHVDTILCGHVVSRRFIALFDWHAHRGKPAIEECISLRYRDPPQAWRAHAIWRPARRSDRY